MAASDKPFHNQRTLDIVYAVSCVLMLLSIVWMLWQDYAREYKTEQRAFREVEVALAQRSALEQVPSEEEFKQAEEQLNEARNFRKEKETDLIAAKDKLIQLRPLKETAEARYQGVKARVDSITSFRNIALEHGEKDAAEKYDAQLKDLNEKLAAEQKSRDDIYTQMKMELYKIDEIEGKFNKAVSALKKVNDRFDAQVKVAINRRWGWGDWLRTQPVINGFADPLKIHQFTISDVPIDYNFKQVTRFDRCMSCHVGIDRPTYTRGRLEELTHEDAHKGKLEEAKKLYERRIKALEGLKDAEMVPNPNQLSLVALSDKVLTPSRITEFCAHPRLELFVGSNSKHPAEKFGCTSCHSGQGSGTSFTDASHTPNNSAERKEWGKDRDWEPNHMWDFPMLPMRFIESSCVKCHHEITDLISSNNRVEAPKLLRGYNLVKENGCFGCHEISGWKSGQRIGPDLRLEPNPPLENLDPIERTRAENDTDNRPGTLRKVGPALTRVSEKVNRAWMEKWIRAPRAFRPDTKMPHYYGLANNDESVLPGEGERGGDQKSFPNTEIASIAYFLMETSKNYLKQAEDQHAKDDDQLRQKDESRLVELIAKGRLDDPDKKEIDQVKLRMKLRREAKLVNQAPGYTGDAAKGRLLFTERGCLSCHVHHGTEEKAQGKASDKDTYAPTLKGEAVFGPDLSQLSGKLGSSTKDPTGARTWLIQWILNPQFHSPRSRMPVTHLTPHEAADVAAWLLAQPAADVDPSWQEIKITEPTRKDMEKLARVYLTRMLSQEDMEKFLKGSLQGVERQVVEGDLAEDEKELLKKVNVDSSLKFYLGKKAVSRLGCYACHDIPGFENAKSIGVGLNDWGKKSPERLAFDDIDNFFRQHYYTVDSLTGKDGIRDKKEPYESFYAEALDHHHRTREGFLNQKIRAPRSYDYNRVLAWDDRARMPKFTLSRPRKKDGEDDKAFEGRIFKEEAEAREAVSTFVLGLVAEQVPSKSINQPTGDRLAEIKGRQVLEKYNCAGCHLIRPGVYDFNASSKAMTKLDEAYKSERNSIRSSGEIEFLNHHNWVGRNPLGDRLTAYGVQTKLSKDPELPEEEQSSFSYVILRLSEALRFIDAEKKLSNIPSSKLIYLPLEDLVSNAKSIKSQEDLDYALRRDQQFGGTFADLLTPWLSERDPKRYPWAGGERDPNTKHYSILRGDSAEARGSLPPTLIGQGERTQGEWLYQFLLNPQPIRRMAILRMPKFNMSNQEARILVDYFAAVTRLTNPGIGLPHSYDAIHQREDLDGSYWKSKNADYVAMLKKTIAKDDKGNLIKGKDGKEMTSYQQRLNAYTRIWEPVHKEQEGLIKASMQKLDDLIQAKTKEKTAKEKQVGDEKGAKKAELEKDIETLDVALKSAALEKATLEKSLPKLDIETQLPAWAYAADSYRLLTSRDLCLKCHQIGSVTASEQLKQGPPLSLASQRLRPNWIEHWVDKPQRFVHYDSLMPQYFNKNKAEFQHLYAGTALEQIEALRDVLANYPRIADLPVNRVHNPDQPADKK